MNLEALGDRIRTAREERRLKQLEVANALQISAQAVSKWERGENAPDISVLLDLARILDVTCDWLLGRAEVDRETFEATVFCSSLNGFAERAGRTAPKELAAWVNGVFHLITEAVLRHEGVPVKYVGDGFLGFFSGRGHAGRAVRAALHARELTGNPELVIVLHSGEIYLGAIGHERWKRPDILGETVNTAFLVMSAVALLGAGIWATASARGAAESGFEWSRGREIRVKGREERLEVLRPSLPGR
jgi:class 3 adenylate cyclase